MLLSRGGGKSGKGVSDAFNTVWWLFCSHNASILSHTYHFTHFSGTAVLHERMWTIYYRQIHDSIQSCFLVRVDAMHVRVLVPTAYSLPNNFVFTLSHQLIRLRSSAHGLSLFHNTPRKFVHVVKNKSIN